MSFLIFQEGGGRICYAVFISDYPAYHIHNILVGDSVILLSFICINKLCKVITESQCQYSVHFSIRICLLFK